MLSLTKQDITARAQSLVSQLSNNSKTIHIDLIDGESAIGGGAGPTANLPTTVIAVSDPNRTAQEIETILRTSSPPVIARIADQKVLLDLRTVFADQEASLLRTLNNL